MDTISERMLLEAEDKPSTAPPPTPEELVESKETYVWWPSVGQVIRVARLAAKESHAHHIAKAMTINDISLDTNPTLPDDNIGKRAALEAAIQGKYPYIT